MSSARTAVSAVLGATGAGKSALIAHLLALRPSLERWAVLQNDFGARTLARETGLPDGNVIVRTVSGCICCTARVALRSGLIALLREPRPQRLLIEASAAAEPQAIATVLGERGIAKAVEVGATICVVSTHQIVDKRYVTSGVYRQQIAAADVIVLRITAEAEECAARAALSRIAPRVRTVIELANAELGVFDK